MRRSSPVGSSSQALRSIPSRVVNVTSEPLRNCSAADPAGVLSGKYIMARCPNQNSAATAVSTPRTITTHRMTSV